MAGRSSRQSSVASRQSPSPEPRGPSREPRAPSRESRAPSREPRAPSPEPRAKGPEPRALSLDRLIHERLRLGIVSALSVNERLTFTDLKRLLHTTDGNLSVHARKLEDAQYIAVEKSFEARMPRTEYRLTAAGRRAFEKYLAHMEALIKAVRD
jgi:DNA-binding MarR family transcriptional regulator